MIRAQYPERLLMANQRPLRLDTWSRANALALLGASVVAALVERPWPISVVALGSFAALLVHASGAFTAEGRFGGANFVTLARLIVVLALGLALHGAPARLLSVLVLLALIVDGLDGWLARREGSESEFGARFDMETDALFVLAVVFELWQRGRFGAWILVAGLLRYLYVLSLVAARTHAPEPRSRLARLAFAVLVVGLALGLTLPGRLGAACALAGTLAVTLSFARSFYWSFGPRPRV